MKKLYLLSFLFFITGCADTVHLGYSNNVGVFYDSEPKNCQQVGMVLLSSGLFTSYLEDEIERLRNEAQKVDGNYVDIKNYDYQAGLTTFSTNHITAVIYNCPKK